MSQVIYILHADAMLVSIQHHWSPTQCRPNKMCYNLPSVHANISIYTKEVE